jgi:hypothetical protein
VRSTRRERSGEFATMTSVPESKEGAVIEAAEESPGECIFIEV